jgi:hypothetical protein
LGGKNNINFAAVDEKGAPFSETVHFTAGRLFLPVV